MKTHMNNTQAMKLGLDVTGHQHFLNHQRALHSSVKPIVVTRRKEEIKVVKNKKVQLNSNPQKHVNHLYSNLYTSPYRSTIDNKNTEYAEKKLIVADKVKKNKYEQAAVKQHQAEVRHLQGRISNCKNLQQRKKDKTDPIVNPTYFIKPSEQAGAISINEYSQKILGMNRPQSGVVQKPSKQMKITQDFYGESPQLQKPGHSYSSVPHYNTKRPQSANQMTSKAFKESNDDLPGCNFKQILNHIVNNKLFKDVEMKVLYVRLCHKYGEELVDDIWQELMFELEK